MKMILPIAFVLFAQMAWSSQTIHMKCFEIYTGATKIDIWANDKKITLRYEDFSAHTSTFITGIYENRIVPPGFFVYRLNNSSASLQIESSLFDQFVKKGRVSFGPNLEKGYYCESE